MKKTPKNQKEHPQETSQNKIKQKTLIFFSWGRYDHLSLFFWLRATQVISTSVLPSVRSMSLFAIFNIFNTFLSGWSYRTRQWQRTECVRHLLLWQIPVNLDTSSRPHSTVQSRPCHPQPTEGASRVHLVRAPWTLLNPQAINTHVLIQTLAMCCIIGQPGTFYARTACVGSIHVLKIPITFWIELIIVHGELQLFWKKLSH